MLNIQLEEEILPEEGIQPDERSMGLRASIQQKEPPLPPAEHAVLRDGREGQVRHHYDNITQRLQLEGATELKVCRHKIVLLSDQRYLPYRRT